MQAFDVALLNAALAKEAEEVKKEQEMKAQRKVPSSP